MYGTPYKFSLVTKIFYPNETRGEFLHIMYECTFNCLYMNVGLFVCLRRSFLRFNYIYIYIYIFKFDTFSSVTFVSGTLVSPRVINNWNCLPFWIIPADAQWCVACNWRCKLVEIIVVDTLHYYITLLTERTTLNRRMFKLLATCCLQQSRNLTAFELQALLHLIFNKPYRRLS